MRDIDELGRLAGARVRTADDYDDVEDRLDDLVHTVQRRRRIKLTGVVAGLALLLGGLGWGVSSHVQSSSLTPADDGNPDVSGDRPDPAPGDTCAIDLVTCKGASRASMRFSMAAPMTWQRPTTFEYVMNVVSNRSGSTAVSIEARRKDAAAGVVVSMPVRAVAKNSGGGGGEPVTAPSLTQWIAARPIVEASRVMRGTLDGLPAWSVEISLKPGATSERCTDRGGRCRPLLWAVGDNSYPAQFIWNGMVARFTLIDVPGAGTASICSWTFAGASSLDGNDPLVHSIHFAYK